MKVSQRGIDFIKKWEGFSAAPYLDSAGFNSIGFGHLVRTGEAFYSVTEAEAEALLRADLKDAEDAVNRFVAVQLTQGQYDALVSWTFNLGADRLKKSTLLRLLNAGDYRGAAREFPKWVYAGGTSLKGLKARRQEERTLFEQGTPRLDG